MSLAMKVTVQPEYFHFSSAGCSTKASKLTFSQHYLVQSLLYL